MSDSSLPTPATHFRMLAVLDRGEDAVRVLSAVAELNRRRGAPLTSTLAVHADRGGGAWFAREADGVLVLGEHLYTGQADGRRRSHRLDVDAVVAEFVAAGVDAVWQGHGVVGDHRRLASSCEAAGIALVGPPAPAVRLIDDRVAFRHAMSAAGLPLLPWSEGAVSTLDEAAAVAERIGYPVRLLAVEASGRRGVTRVAGAQDLPSAFDEARRRAVDAEGDPAVLVERDAGPARRLEVVVLADDAGTVWTLDVRDTSLRRGRQRVVLSSPCPGLDPQTEAALRQAAVDVCGAVGYRNAGTVRFVLAPDARSFYVTGVDARLELQPALTEEVCGIDLVAERLRLAAGGLLTGDAPVASGHAVEALLRAVDPLRGFELTPGRVAQVEPPFGTGVRVDTGVRVGDQVMEGSDPLLATVTAWGRDRSEALDRLGRALERTSVVVEGGCTDRSFLLGILADEKVRAGAVTDTWLDAFVAGGGAQPAHDPLAVVAAAIIAYEQDAEQVQAAFLAKAARGRPEPPPEVGDRIALTYRGGTYRVRVDRTAADTYQVSPMSPAGQRVSVRTEQIDDYGWRLWVGGLRHLVHVVASGPRIFLEVDGVAHELSRADGVVVSAPGPAIVVSLAVEAGDKVEAGDLVAVLETMKMETPVRAPVSGTVLGLDVSPNAQVGSGAPLLRVRRSDPGQDGEQPSPTSTLDLRALLAAGQESTDREPDGAPHHPGLPCERLYDRVSSYLLGYDLAPTELSGLLAEQKAVSAGVQPYDEHLQTCEDSLLDLYADLGTLSRPRTEATDEAEDLAGTGAREYLEAYLQWLDPDRAGLSPSYRERLATALQRYGVTSLVRSPELEAAAVRLSRSIGRMRAMTPMVVAILQRRLGVHPAVPETREAASELRARYDRLAAATQGRYQVVADLARDVRFRHFDEPVLESVVAGISDEMDAHLAALRADPDGVDREDHLAALVACPQPLRGKLLHAWLGEESGSGSTGEADGATAFRAALLEVYARRFYRIRQLSTVRAEQVDGHLLASAGYQLDDRLVHLVVGYVPLAGLPELCRAVKVHLQAVPESHEVVLDVVTWREGERPSVEETATEVTDLLRRCDTGRRLHRLDVTVTSTAGTSPEHFRTQHLTFRDDDTGGLTEDVQYRNLHPMLAKRLSLWRLRNFALDRLPSAEDVYLFLGVARENPKDRRLFALAEVRDLTPLPDPVSGRAAYPMLERVGLRALAAMRDALAGLSGRGRPAANRLVLSVRPPWTVPHEEWRSLAATFAPLAVGAGLEKVVLRVRIPAEQRSDSAWPGEPLLRETALHVEGLTGGALTVTERPLGSSPVSPLSPYDQKVLLAARFGAPYPYEITRTLAPVEGTEGSFPRGRFVELDLAEDGETLVEVDREPGENSAHLVVGLLTSYTDLVPEGVTRVAILSDPTKGLGNLAEPECRRINAALALATERKLPVEWFAVSSGALISLDSGTENMDWISLTLRRIIGFTQGGGEINIVVTGINVGGQPYWNAEATMLMHTRGILVMTPVSAMVLTGKQALDFSGGVSAEDNFGIGGYDRVMGPNGQGQYWAPSFEAACGLLLRHYEHTYVVPGERFPRRRATVDPPGRDIRTSPHHDVPGSDFAVVGEVFENNPDRKKPFDMRSVMRAVADVEAEPLERWQRWLGGENTIVWDAFVGGIPVCMLGLESRTTLRRGYVPADGPLAWTSGTLFPQASRKAARAINATSGNRPLVVLANLSGFDGSPESMRHWQLEYGAEIGRAVTNFRGPIVFCVVSRYHGGAFVVFSKSLNPSMEIAAVEGSYASVIGGAPAAATVFAREVKIRTEKDPQVVAAREAVAEAPREKTGAARARLAEVTEMVRSAKLGEVADEFDGIHTIERALRVGSVDHIIAAKDVRPWVIDALERGMAKHTGG